MVIVQALAYHWQRGGGIFIGTILFTDAFWRWGWRKQTYTLDSGNHHVAGTFSHDNSERLLELLHKLRLALLQTLRKGLDGRHGVQLSSKARACAGISLQCSAPTRHVCQRQSKVVNAIERSFVESEASVSCIFLARIQQSREVSERRLI